MLSAEITFAFALEGEIPEMLSNMDRLTASYKLHSLQRPPELGTTMRILGASLREEILGIRRITYNLDILGLISDDTRKTVQKINSILMAYYSLYMMYKSYESLVKYLKRKDAAESAALVAANANPFSFWKIILAAAITAFVAASLGRVWAKNNMHEETTQQVDLPMFNIHDAAERREAVRQIGDVVEPQRAVAIRARNRGRSYVSIGRGGTW